MKISELIELLQDELGSFGDRDVVFNCDDLEPDSLREIGALGWYSDLREGSGRKATMIICAECEHKCSSR